MTAVQAGPPVTQLPVDSGETAPKRRRGRPPGSKTGSGSRPGSAAASRVSLETRIGGMLVLVNMALYMVPPLQRDALDPVELAALAKAIDAQCKQSVRFRRYVEAMLTAGSGGQLFGVVAIIGARRMARHGVLPAEVDGMLGGMLANNAPTTPTAPTFEHDGTNGTAAAA